MKTVGGLKFSSYFNVDLVSISLMTGLLMAHKLEDLLLKVKYK